MNDSPQQDVMYKMWDRNILECVTAYPTCSLNKDFHDRNANFRRNNHPLSALVNILGMDVDVLKTYKYLRVHLNNNLD